MTNEFQCLAKYGPVFSLKVLKSGICQRVQTDAHFLVSVPCSSARCRRRIWKFSGCRQLFKLQHQEPKADISPKKPSSSFNYFVGC